MGFSFIVGGIFGLSRIATGKSDTSNTGRSGIACSHDTRLGEADSYNILRPDGAAQSSAELLRASFPSTSSGMERVAHGWIPPKFARGVQ